MTRGRQRQATFLVSAAVLAAVLAACGGSETSDGDSKQDDTTTTTRARSGTTSTTAADTGSNFVAPELAGTSWNVTRYQLPTGSMTNLWPGTEINVAFGADGTASGFSGCNTYDGTYVVEGEYNEDSGTFDEEQKGQAIVMDGFSVTEIGCEDTTMDQEGEYLDDLLAARFWLLNKSGNLVLHDSEGFFLVEGEPLA